MNVVVVDEELPYPPNSGKRLRTLNLVTRLARRHRITYLAHRNQDPIEAIEAETYLRNHGIEVIVVDPLDLPKSGLKFHGRLAANLCSPLPYSVQSHKSAALQRAVRRLSETGNVDLWHVEWTPYAENIRKIVRKPWVVMAHNIESQIWQRYHETESNPVKRSFIAHQLKKFRRFERAVFTQASRTIVVSESDADLALRWFSIKRPEVVSNGVDIEYFRPTRVEHNSDTVLFLGSLDWRPNQDAVRWLLDDIFPQLVSQRPGILLSIVGRNPPRWLSDAVHRRPGVKLHADVPDVRPYLAATSAMVVPLRIGGGTRLKILEAAAAGVPVVSTAVGAEGLSMLPGDHYLQADSTGTLAAALVRILQNPNSSYQMACSARHHAEMHYAWPAIADNLERIWDASAGIYVRCGIDATGGTVRTR